MVMPYHLIHTARGALPQPCLSSSFTPSLIKRTYELFYCRRGIRNLFTGPRLRFARRFAHLFFSAAVSLNRRTFHSLILRVPFYPAAAAAAAVAVDFFNSANYWETGRLKMRKANAVLNVAENVHYGSFYLFRETCPFITQLASNKWKCRLRAAAFRQLHFSNFFGGEGKGDVRTISSQITIRNIRMWNNTKLTSKRKNLSGNLCANFARQAQNGGFFRTGEEVPIR